MKMRWLGNRSLHAAALEYLLRLALMVLIALTISLPVRAGDWRGTVVEKEGITHVRNPAAPITEPVSLTPAMLWSVGGDEEEDYFFGVISGIVTDEAGNVYMLDIQLNEVMVFSPQGEYLRSIGREGEGPGEFRRPADLFMTTTGQVGVVQRMPGKIVLLTPEGEPAGNFPAPEAPDGGFQMFASGRLAGEQMILATMQFQRRDDGMREVSELIGVDAAGNKTAQFLAIERSRNFANMEFNEKDLSLMSLVWTTSSRGQVYICDDFDSYRIKVHNPDGTVDRVVERAYELRVRSNEEIEQNTPHIRIRSNNTALSPEVHASKTDRAVMQIYPRDDGSFWVLSSHGAFDAPDGVIGTFDIFDSDGKFSRQVSLAGEGSLRRDGILISGDRLYVVKGLRSARRAMANRGSDESADEEDVEPVSVLCYDIGGV